MSLTHLHSERFLCDEWAGFGDSLDSSFTKQLLTPQVALTCTQIWWTTEVGIAFARLEEGYENAMRDYYKKQVAQLKTLITMLIGQLSKGDRQKIMTICTIDVHARDVVAKMIAQKVSLKHPALSIFVGSYIINIGVREKLAYGQNLGTSDCTG